MILRTRFADLRIGYKLALGFAAVLALTLSTAMIGLAGINGMDQSATRLEAISRFGARLAAVEIARLHYLHHPSGQPRPVFAALDDLYEAEHQLESIGGGMGQQGATFKLIRQSLASYRQAFKHLVSARNSREQSIRRGIAAGRQGQKIYADFQKQYFKKLSNLYDLHAELGQIKRVGYLNYSFGQIRIKALGYTLQKTPSAAKAAFEAVDRLMKSSQTLVRQLPADSANALSKTEVSLTQFARTLRGEQQSVAQMAEATKRMKKSASRMLAANKSLQRNAWRYGKVVAARQWRLLLMVSLGAVGIALLTAWLITRSITGPLKNTVELVEQVADGDLRCPNIRKREDELGRLQQAMLHMTGGLRELVAKIATNAGQVSARSTGLNEQALRAHEDLTLQQGKTDQVTAAMHQMTMSIAEVASNAERGAASARAANNEAMVGQGIVESVVKAVSQLADRVRLASQVVTQLSDSSQEITTVLDVIKSVAEQTNLLALNAAIEAARAGKAGQGFSVVADEVRDLAQRTHASAREIEGLIATLKDNSSETGRAMQVCVDMAGSVLEQAGDAGERLQSVAGAVSVILGMSEHIATAIEQQSSVSENIKRDLSEVRNLTENSVRGTEQTTQAGITLEHSAAQVRALISRFSFDD